MTSQVVIFRAFFFFFCPLDPKSESTNKKILALSRMALINTHAEVSSEARGLNFGPCLHLCSYSVNVSNKGSGESAQFYRLVWALATGRFYKYWNIGHWPIYFYGYCSTKFCPECINVEIEMKIHFIFSNQIWHSVRTIVLSSPCQSYLLHTKFK